MRLGSANWPSWWAFVLAGALILAAGAAGGAIIAAAGIYNVAASKGHWSVTRVLLEFGMERSVDTHSMTIDPPDLFDPEMIALGAGHYQGACAPCHGGPGFDGNPVAAHMLPAPPKLEEHIDELEDRQIFWIVKHGLKYTGMPAWPSQRRDDEVWAVVAFLRGLDGMEPARYRQLADGNLPQQAEPAQAATGTSSDLTACVRCHDNDKAAPVSTFVPRLAGQSRTYLARSLRAYASGERESGIMQPVAAELDDEDIERLADFFAGLSPVTSPDTRPAASVQAGEEIAINGDPASDIPACETCHGADASADFPRLAGQPASYLRGQLHLWQQGLRQAGPGAVMAPIADRMDEEQIDAVAAYYASLPAGLPAGNGGADN